MQRQQFMSLRTLSAMLTPPLERGGVPTDEALHLLNRITWGPRQQDVERCREIGIEATLEEQLNPEAINDEEADALIAEWPILQMDRKTIRRVSNQYTRPQQSLIAGVVLRAVYSRRQLLERMVDFWTDHLNVPLMDEGEFAVELVPFQREVIRRYALGSFREMLFASAKNPAMLIYLDNFVNVKDAPNENYARELLELHTMGVEGGYTEEDIREVARAFTGWTVHDGTDDGFYFNMAEHDTGAKTVLGHRLPAGRGIEDGLHVLNILANHPATARFLSLKLCRRFVSDNPPAELVNSTAEVWQATGGDIKAVLRYILLSEAFFASAGQKFRRPLEFFIGALRATGAVFYDRYMAREMMLALGQLPYNWQPPNGYPDVAAAWLNTGGLLARWNAAHTLTTEAYSSMERYGINADLHEHIGEVNTAAELVDAVALRVFGARPEGEFRAALVAYASDGEGASAPATYHLKARKLATLYHLMLASPEYQWR